MPTILKEQNVPSAVGQIANLPYLFSELGYKMLCSLIAEQATGDSRPGVQDLIAAMVGDA